MTTVTTPVAPSRSRGRGWFWAGIGICVLALALNFIQFNLGLLKDPWYVAVMITLGAVMVLYSVIQRRSVTRILGLVLVAALALGLWTFLLSLSKLPTYEGPAQAGQSIPAFQTTLADGRSFTDKDLRDGKPTVLVFNRGRW